MKRYMFILSLFLIFINLASCKLLDLSAELKQFDETMKDASERIALAVPGEMFLQMLRECNAIEESPQKEACKNLAQKLLNVDPDDATTYQMSAWFKYDESKTKLRVDLIPWDDNDYNAVNNICSNGQTNYRTDLEIASSNLPISSDSHIPLSDQQLIGLRNQHLVNAVESIRQEMLAIRHESTDTGSMHVLGGRRLGSRNWDGIARSALVKAFEVQFEQPNYSLEMDRTITKPWSFLYGRPFAVVIIQKQDWDNLILGHNKNKVQVSKCADRFPNDEFAIDECKTVNKNVDLNAWVAIHAADDPKKLLKGTNKAFLLTPEDFNYHRCSPHNKPHHSIMWAVQYVSNDRATWVTPKKQMEENISKIKAFVEANK